MSKLKDWRPMMPLAKAVSQWWGSQRRLVRLVARNDHPVHIEREARKMVEAGLSLNRWSIIQDTARVDLAGTCIGMSEDPSASVIEIWLGVRRWRPALAIDSAVDDALRDLAPSLYLRYGAASPERDDPARTIH